MNQYPKKADRHFWLRLVGSLLAVGLLIILLREQDWAQIKDVFTELDAWRLWSALLLTIFSRLAITWRWHTLLRSITPKLQFSQSLRLTFAGLFSSNFLPTTIGGDMVRLVGAVQMRIDPTKVALSLVADRLVGMTAMAAALPWGLARLFTLGLPVLFTFQDWASGFLLIGFIGDAYKRLVNKLSGFIQRINEDLSYWLKHPLGVILAFVFTCVHMLFLFSTIWLVLDGMQETISWLQIAGIWSLVYFITLLPISVNGYGLQEVSATVLYSRLGGISLSASLAVALLIRSLQIVVSLPGAAFIPGIIPTLRKRQEIEMDADSAQENNLNTAGVNINDKRE